MKEGTDVLWKCPRCNNLNNTVSSDVEKIQLNVISVNTFF